MNEVERLMKRCQTGCGGRNALDDAHGLLAECYGTLGLLDARLQIATEALRYYENRSPEHGTRNTAAVALDEIEATKGKKQAEIARLKDAAAMLNDRAKALYHRWHSPLWKDLDHTGDFIARLKIASENLEDILNSHQEAVDSLPASGRRT